MAGPVLEEEPKQNLKSQISKSHWFERKGQARPVVCWGLTVPINCWYWGGGEYGVLQPHLSKKKNRRKSALSVVVSAKEQPFKMARWRAGGEGLSTTPQGCGRAQAGRWAGEVVGCGSGGGVEVPQSHGAEFDVILGGALPAQLLDVPVRGRRATPGPVFALAMRWEYRRLKRAENGRISQLPTDCHSTPTSPKKAHLPTHQYPCHTTFF